MPRQSRLGLGAKPLSHAEIQKMNKNGDNSKRIIEGRQEDLHKLKIGTIVQIIDGTHKGKQAKIININIK